MSTELSTLGSVIKTAYEAEADTNAFTDAEKTKLTGIETAADVTDTANVTAAGALMDSEVTNLAAVKAFDPTDYATAAQGSTADTALQAVSDDTTPTLGGALDAGGFNISNLGDVLFKTGATGGTLRTGTSAADKFQLQGYDVDGAAYRTVLEVDAGNDVRMQLPVVYLDLEDATDTTKVAKFDASGITTGTTRTFAFPDASGTFALSDNIEGAAIKSTGEVGASKFLREDGDGTCSWQSVPASGGDLLADGTVPLTANWDVGAFAITALQFHSDITTGTAPFTVASSTVVTNLNADLLDGNEASAFAAAAHAHEGTAILSTGPVTDGYVLTADGAGGAAWEAAAAGGTPAGSSGDIQYNNAGSFGGSYLKQGTNTLEQYNSTTAQTFNVYHTRTDASNYERGAIKWASNEFVIATEKAGTGSSRNIYVNSLGILKLEAFTSVDLIYRGTTKAKVTSGGIEPAVDGASDSGGTTKRWGNTYTDIATVTNYINIDSGYTVATLPTPATGMIAYVTDASAPSIGSAVSSGGAAFALVCYNGSAWNVIGV